MATPQASQIQNAQIRYQNQIAERGTEAHVDRETEKAQYKGGLKNTRKAPKKMFKTSRPSDLDVSKDTSNENFLLDDISNLTHTERKSITAQRVDEVHFPIFIFLIALFKDILDIPSTLSLIGIFLSVVFSFFISLVLFLWIFGKMNGGWWKKRLISYLWKRFILISMVELIPIFQLIPATTIFILMAHYREKKIVKLANTALETAKLVYK